jgi:hypothetical protein
MKETELKPCPFCGGKAELNIGKIGLYDGIYPAKYQLRVGVAIKCTKCRMSEGEYTAAIDLDHEKVELKWSIYETAAVKALFKRWNRRADNEQREAD